MLASLSGSLALLLGLAVMLLPLLGPELSRPRDSAWGALVLLLGLTLVTSADRLSGAPMLAVLCGGLLIGRLGGEVMQLRWRRLTAQYLLIQTRGVHEIGNGLQALRALRVVRSHVVLLTLRGQVKGGGHATNRK